MKNSFSIMKYIFCIIGLMLLVLAFFKYLEKMAFIEKATVGKGKIEVIVSDDKSIVSFKTKKGKQLHFTSYNSINPLSNNEEKNIEVLYDPLDPMNAKVNNFGSLYLGISFVGLIGAVFLLTGLSFFRSDYSKQKKIQFLKQNGKAIITKFVDVQINLKTINDRHPYFICSKWIDSKNNKTYLFESDDIWFDPTEYIKTDEIMVLIDPKNPEKYYMDISFLSV